MNDSKTTQNTSYFFLSSIMFTFLLRLDEVVVVSDEPSVKIRNEKFVRLWWWRCMHGGSGGDGMAHDNQKTNLIKQNIVMILFIYEQDKGLIGSG